MKISCSFLTLTMYKLNSKLFKIYKQVSIFFIFFSKLFYFCDFSFFYYTERHCWFQKACCTFLWKYLISHAFEWECEKHVLTHVFKTFAKYHMLLSNLLSSLSVAWLKRLDIHDILSIKMKNWDLIYIKIYLNEMT